MLKVSSARIRQLIAAGQLPAVKVGRDHLLNFEAVQRFDERGRRKAGRPKKESG
jgi:excisionase family DNA binding protein